MTDDGHTFTNAQQNAAATWLARRDRELSRSEHAAYNDWLAEDPAHGLAMNHVERAWLLCDQLVESHPAYLSQENSTSVAPRAGKTRWLAAAGALSAIAATIAIVLFLTSGPPDLNENTVASGPDGDESFWVLTGTNGDQLLEDGSLIEMQPDAIIVVNFTANERRVELVRGEVSFTVAHDPSKPFVVEVGGVTVQALGTVFRVGLDHFDVSVEVTEGSVEVRDPEAQTSESGHGIVIAAGEKTVLQYRRLIPYTTPRAESGDESPRD